MSKLFIDIFSLFCISIMIGLIVLIFINKPKKLNQSLLWFTFPTYIVAFSLFMLNSFYVGFDIPIHFAILKNFVSALSLFALRINEINVTALVNENLLYSIAITITYFLAACNILLDVSLIVFKNFHNSILLKKYSSKAHFIILGDIDEVFDFANKLNDKCVVIIENNEKNKEFVKQLKNSKVAYILSKDKNASLLKANINANNTIVISLETNEEENIKNSVIISNILPSYNKAYIRCNSLTNKDFYNVNQKNIIYFNHDLLIAQNFLNRYPLLQYLPNEYIDTSKAMLNDKYFDNIFIGYSNASNEILELLMLNYQYINRTFNVKIFDKNAKQIKENLKSKYYVNEKIKSLSKDEYYDQLPVSNNITFDDLDDDSLTFKETILDNLDRFTFFYVDYNNDSINIEKALSLQNYLMISNKKDYVIFVKVSDDSLFDIKALNAKNIYLYGEDEKIYAKQIIVDEILDDLAKSVNYFYHINYENDGKSKDEVWAETPLLSKNSSRSSANNIIVKLNLLGLSLSTDKEGISKEQYLNIYNDNLPLNRNLNVDIDYKFDNKRINLGILEHLRWNTFEILNNHMPMKKKDILNSETKKYVRKNTLMHLHANITSLKGLLDLENDIKNCDFLPNDVKDKESQILIKDFDTMDNLYEILSYSNYKIVKRN